MTGFCQGVKIVGELRLSEGYLVWELQNSNIAYSVCTINLNIIINDIVLASPVAKTEVWNDTYLKIADEFWNVALVDRWYSATISGYVNSHSLIGLAEINLEPIFAPQTGPIGGVGILLCYWQCVGSNYAYTINASAANGINYSMGPAYANVSEEGVLTYHYRWFSESEFTGYTCSGTEGSTGTGNPAFHSMAAGWESDIDPNSEKVIRLLNPGGVIYCDSNGGVITSEHVYGIMKGYWHWFQDFYSLHTDYADYCDQPFLFLINLLNSEDINSGYPLACSAAQDFGCGYTFDNGYASQDEIDTSTMECGTVYTYDGFAGGMGSAIGVEWGCHNIQDYLNGGGGLSGSGAGGNVDSPNSTLSSLLSHTELFRINRLGKNSGIILDMAGSEMVDSQGVPNFPAQQLSPGLYKVIAKFPDYPLDYFLIELTEVHNLSLAHRAFFTALAFPNPHTGNTINFTLTTEAKLSANYEMFDAMGNLIHGQFFELPNDHKGNQRISSSQNIPTGFVFHKFTFQDGSIYILTSLKQ